MHAFSQRAGAYGMSAPANLATAFMLNGPTSGVTGAASTFTVTPNAPLSGSATVNISAPGATLSTASLSFASGATAGQTFTVTRASDGTTSVSITNTLGLTNSSPISHTTTAASTFTTFTVNSAAGGTDLPFTFGQVFEDGDIGPSQVALATGGTDWQCVPTTYWPSGNVRHAIIAGRATCTAGVDKVLSLVAGADPGGTALTEADLATALTGTNTIAIDGFSWNINASIGTADRHRTVCTGPVMSNFIYRKPVTGNSHLVMWADIRVYQGGEIEVFPWIENGYFLTSGPTRQDYGEAVVTLGGTERYRAYQGRTMTTTAIGASTFTTTEIVAPGFTGAMRVRAGSLFGTATYASSLNGVHTFDVTWDTSTPSLQSLQFIGQTNRTRLPLVSGSNFSHWLGTDPQITPKHHGAYLRSTKMVPNYSGVTPTSANLDGLQQTYTSSTNAMLSTGGWASNGSAAILGGTNNPSGPFYILSQDPRAWRGVMTLALSSGSHSLHYRDATTNEPISFASFPDASIQVQDSPTVPTGTGGANSGHNISHQPEFAYLAWLCTGRWFFLEAQLFLASYNYLNQTTASRLNAGGVIRTTAGANTDRGAAWGLRTLAQTLVSLPSTHSLFNSFKASWEANMLFYATQNNTTNNGGIGVNTLGVQGSYLDWANPPYQGSNGGGTNWATYAYSAGWMQNMIHGVIGFAWDLSLPQSSTSQGHHQTVRDFGYTMPVMLSGDGTGTNWDYRNFAVFGLNMGYTGGVGVGGYYPDWTNRYADYKAGFSITPTGNSLYGHSSATPIIAGSSSFPYFGQGLQALAYAVDHAKPGATEGWRRVISANNFHSILAATSGTDQYAIACYAVAPRSLPMPAWLQGMAVAAWKELPNTSLSTSPVMAAPRGSNAPQGKVDSWIGHAADRRTCDLISPGCGGHDDYWGNEVNRLRLTADNPAWEQLTTPTLSANVNNNEDYNLDGKPASQHTYGNPVFSESLNRVLRMPGGSRSKSGNPSALISAYNVATGAWDAEGTWHSLAAPASVSAGGQAYAKHPITEDVFCWFGNAAIYRWNKGVPGSWTFRYNFPPAVNYTAGDVDPSRGAGGIAFFLGGGLGGNICHAYDIAANTLTAITLTGVDIKAFQGIGLQYVAAVDRYFAFVPSSGGSAVYVITPTSGTTWACALYATTGGSAMPVTDGNSAFAPYTKPQYFPALGVVAYLPRWTANTWVLRLH